MKKLILSLVVVLSLAFAGYVTQSNHVTTRTIDNDIEQLADGSIIISGGVDEDTYKEFLRATLDGKRHYTIRLMTNGGCAYNTIAIMTRMAELQKQGVKFTTMVMGHGFSAGSYIFMMGDERIMGSGANLMWHTMSGVAKVTGRMIPQDRIKMITEMDHWVVEMFEKRFPNIPKEWIQRAFWDENLTWMSAKEALFFGIATRVLK
jgi:ATP-dependent protease ClpP protease subunit